MPDPNIIGVNDLTTPAAIGSQPSISGIYTETAGPITAVNVLRSNDGANSFKKLIGPVGVAGNVFSIPIAITGPAGFPIYFKVEDANDPDTFGLSNAVEVDSLVAAPDWTVTGVSLTNIPPRGGVKITVTGNSTDFGDKFKPGTYAVHLGPAGDDSDPICYPGIAGGGNTQTFGVERAELIVYTPKLDPSVGNKITVVRNAEEIYTLNAPTVTVEQLQFGTLTHKIRKFFPPWLAVGPRSLEFEP